MSLTPYNNLKRPAAIAIGAMALLLVGAFVFYRERMLFADASFITFSILDLHRFYIQEHRFGSFITQLVPWLGQKYHWPIKTILIGYSASFNIFYLLVSLILYRMRQYSLVLLHALYYFLFVTESYYWTNNEIHQAISWMFLAFAAYRLRKNATIGSALYFVLFPALAFLTVFTHFVVIIPVVFLFAYDALDIEERSKKLLIPSAIILAVIMGAKVALSLNQPYDGSALHGVTHFSIKDVVLTFFTPVAKMFALRCFTLYWPALIMAVLGFVSLRGEGRKKQLAWTVVASIGYVIVMGLTYGGYDRNFALYHIESEWASLSIIWGTPFIFSWLPKQKVRVSLLVISTLFLIRICYVTASAQRFKARNEFKSYVMNKMRERGIYRLAIYDNDSLIKVMGLEWALPEETLLTSSLDGDTPRRTFRFVSREETTTLEDMQRNPGVSFKFTWLLPKDLDAFYFPSDSSRPYTVTTWEDFEK